jgi:GTP-binding protein
MSKPLIAIVGRPNVGKSTLFNRLARKRIAVVEDFAGTTRDRLYADCDIWGNTCTLIDTGGFDLYESEGYTPSIVAQAQIAIDEADIIVFVTDGREEPSTLDYDVAELLRRTRKPVILAANKIDNPTRDITNLYALRLGEPVIMSALTGIGVAELTEKIEDHLPRETEEYPEDDSLKVALVGRPNVGKSALTNRILGFERSIVSPVAGTTRDAIDTKLTWKDQAVTLIDTAGMRRKARVRAEETAVEYHMVLRSLRAIDRSDVVIIVCESGGVTEQDTKIAGYAHEAGKAVVVVVNKWDLIEETPPVPAKPTKREKKDADKRTLAQKDYSGMIERYLPFISYAPVHFTSAETGQGIEAMFDDALAIAPNVRKRVSTGALNDTIRRAISDHAIPSVKGRQMKIRYATQADVQPPLIIIFCNHPDQLHFSYVRYLENAIRRKFEFRGVPLRIELRKGSGEQTKEERLAAKRAVALIEDRKKYGGDIDPEWEQLAIRSREIDALEGPREDTAEDDDVEYDEALADEFSEFFDIEGGPELEITGPEEVARAPRAAAPARKKVNPTRNASERAKKTGPDLSRSGGKKKSSGLRSSSSPPASDTTREYKGQTGGSASRSGRSGRPGSSNPRSSGGGPGGRSGGRSGGGGGRKR